MTEAARRQRNELFQGAVIAEQGFSLDIWQGVKSSVCQGNPQEGAAPGGQTVQSSMMGILSKLCYRSHCGTTKESPGAVEPESCAGMLDHSVLKGKSVLC